MSLFTQALAGAGSAAADLANKYIDDEILRNRQQAFLDMQRRNAQQTREDDYTFRSDPTRVASERANKVADITATSDALNEANLRGKRNEAGDQTITAGQADRERALAQARGDVAVDVAGRTARAAADVQFESQKRALQELGGLEVKLAGDKADAVAKAQAKYREKPQGAASPAEKLAQIRDALGRDLTPQEKEALLGLSKAEGNAPFAKMVNDATQKALEGGLIKPEEAGAYADKIKGSFVNVQVQAQMAPVVSKARRDNNISSLVGELKSQGFSPEQIVGFGVTQDELKAAAPQSKPSEPAKTGGRSLFDSAVTSSEAGRLRYLQNLKSSGAPMSKADEDELRRREAGQQ